jgi:hypothetical protein
VAGVEEVRGRGGESTVDRGGRRSFEGGDGVPVAGGQESGGEVARKLSRGDVVLVVCLAGAERWRSVRTTVRPSGGGARAHRRSGPVVLAWESEIGWACENQWVAVVLLEHWIKSGRWQRRLTTASQGSGGAPARVVERRKEREVMRHGGTGKRSREGLLGKLSG